MNKESSICPLCSRPAGGEMTEHHLIPKVRGGKKGPKVLMHRICHDKIHSVFGENELRDRYNTVKEIKAHPMIRKFVRWVAKKDPGFYDSSKQSERRKKGR